MHRLEVATNVHVDRETVFEFLRSFPLYADYSEYLADVTSHGDGGPGTEYDLHLAWWRLSYTARSRVTGVDPPDRIEWRLVGDLDARGAWVVEEVEAGGPDADREAATVDGGSIDPGESGAGVDPVTRVRLVVRYDPASADDAALGLPRLLSVDALVDRVAPLARAEAERVVERIVADLEGEPRPVDLEVLDRSRTD